MLETTEKYIFIASRNLFPLLYAFKADHPESDIKLLSKQDVISRLGNCFASDPIPSLLKQHYSYRSAKQIMRLLNLVGDKATKELKRVYQQLESEGLIAIDEYGKRELEQGKLCLIELENDAELTYLLRNNGLEFQNLNLESLGLKANDLGDSHPDVYLYPDKFSQYVAIYSDIRHRLVSDPALANKIVILMRDDFDLFYIQTISKLFGIPTYCKLSRPFLSTEAIAKQVKEIHVTRSFAFDETEELEPLGKLIVHYGLDDEKLDFDFRYACLLEIASAMSLPVNGEEKGIVATNSFVIDPDQIVYVTNFQYGDFYQVADDNDYFPDDVLENLHANPSYVKTKLDRVEKLNFLKYAHIAFLSRVGAHLSDKIYDSQFIQELNWTGKEGAFPGTIKINWSDSGFYTSDAALLFKAHQCDRAFAFKPWKGYRDYDHSFSGFEDDYFQKKKSWSVTKLERYVSCPYQFYLDEFIQSPPSDPHNIALGSYVHKILEHLNEGLITEETFEEGLAEYKDNLRRNGGEFGPKNDLYLRIVRHHLEKIIAAMRDSVANANYAPGQFEYPEQKISFEVAPGYCFNNARIDKVLLTQGPMGERYYTIFDYKTGSERFDYREVFIGKSLQLPLYYFAIEQNKDNEPYDRFAQFGGFGIVPCFASSPKSLYCDDKNDYNMDKLKKGLLPAGMVLNMSSYLGSYYGQADEKGEYGLSSKNLFIGEDGKLRFGGRRKNVKIEATFESILDDAKAAVIRIVDEIRQNQFQIAPAHKNIVSESKELHCKYCSYRNVCFRDAEADARSYKAEIAAHFKPFSLEDEKEEEEESDE